MRGSPFFVFHFIDSWNFVNTLPRMDKKPRKPKGRPPKKPEFHEGPEAANRFKQAITASLNPKRP
jgi:hypothetical protein